jgi:energy-coupling factor transporter ATP-binding protein EcfA2
MWRVLSKRVPHAGEPAIINPVGREGRNMKGIVFGEIRPFRVHALLTEYQEGEAILGRLVQIKNGDKLVIGRVVDFRRFPASPEEHDHVSFREETVLDIELLTALSGGTRVPFDSPIELPSEVKFLEDFPFERNAHTGYLGHFWGTNIKAPLILQDFQTLKEAYHFFVAGQTGSGKSTLVQMLLALYNKLNPRMNFLILDTVGEFTASFKGERELFLQLKDVWKGDVEICTPPKNLTLKTIKDVIGRFLNSALEGSSGKCVVLDLTLYKAGGDPVALRTEYVRETLRQLYNAGLELYRRSGNLNLNTLVVLEEAHNYVPKRTDDDESTVLSNEIVKYFIETKDFGIGWMCITTWPSNVRREVFDHSRVKFIGMGLTNGPDAELLKEAFGPEFLNIYRLFPDPLDPLSPKKEFCFAISGPITILSRQSPEFITVFSSKEEFIKANWEEG